MVTRLKDSLLLIGSETSSRPELRAIFASAYHLLEADNHRQALMLLEQNRGCIAAVIADLPEQDDAIRALGEACNTDDITSLPLIVLLDIRESGPREEMCFLLGATDVVLKPFVPAAIQRRVQVMIDLYLHKWNLEKLVAEQSTAIRNTNQVMLDALSAIIEHRSTESGNHILRIRRFTKILLEEVARACPEYGLDDRLIDIIAGAAALHDIGKISIPDAILNKSGRLTPEEYATMKTHTEVGARMLQNLAGMGDTEYLRYAYNICLYHHERWDGRGYPMGLKEDEIPICAQVVGIADVFDALTSPRVYKPALPHEVAMNMILNGECGVFSPRLLACFKNVRTAFVELATQYSDGYSPKSDNITLSLPGPVWKSNSLNTLQIAQVKYQALLHYLDDTVLELDLDSRLFHMVYNPNPDLNLLPATGAEELLYHLQRASVHPADLPVLEEIWELLNNPRFAAEFRRRVFRYRLYSAAAEDFVAYDMMLIRVNTGNENQRIVLAIWHRLESFDAKSRLSLRGTPVLQGLENVLLRCRSDGPHTIEGGARELYSLTGFTPEELQVQFGTSLLPLLPEADRPVLEEALAAGRSSGEPQDLEFRLQTKLGTALWVQDRLRVYVEENGQEAVYHALTNNSRDHAIRARLETELERVHLLLDQMESLPFELDMVRDYMTSSPKWEKHFGYSPRTENFLAELSHSHFHPDDVALLRAMIQKLEDGTPSAATELRLINDEGRYVWCTFAGSGQYDEDGRLLRIVGLLTDIDRQKRTELALKEQAERDPLTRLLNKNSAQALISEHLRSAGCNSLNALMVLDLDNFKAVNDNYGHLYGDAVLNQVSANLRRLFRPTDIISRIGGDEFMVLLKDIPNREMVCKRCELLLTAFRQQMEQLVPDVPCSWSIGVALAPSHGSTYAELFKHADEALYLAKSSGKNTYRLYDSQFSMDLLRASGEHTLTRIDSDEQPGMANSSFIRFVFQRLYESRDLERTIDEILAYVGQQFNVSRVYIFENNEDNTTCSNTFEWCNEGIAPEISNLQNVSYIEDIAGWPEVFNERGVFYCSDISGLEPHFRAILEPQGIKSMLQCSILDEGVFRGYIGFDECNLNRLWTAENISLLEFLSQVIGLFLLKQRSREKERQRELTV